jgi:hypothetical protein
VKSVTFAFEGMNAGGVKLDFGEYWSCGGEMMRSGPGRGDGPFLVCDCYCVSICVSGLYHIYISHGRLH